jgi:hypothetical protein
MSKLFDRQLIWLVVFLAGCAGGPNEVHVPGEQGSMPVISNLVYTVTESTIVATWTTDTSSDSNLSAGGKAAIDNGVAANSTSHQAIVTGLLNNTVYSCVVTSGGTSSSPQNVTTSPARNRIPVLSATNGATSVAAFAPTGGGDSLYSFISSDNVAYMTENDGFGFSGGANNAGANLQIGKITNESTFAGADVNLMTSYLGVDTTNGTDGPGSTPLRGGCWAPFSIGGNLFMFLGRNNDAGTFGGYGNIIKDNGDHGLTWNRFDLPSSFAANGQGPGTGIFEYAQSGYWYSSPVVYGKDDGTLGYNAAGNQIDGANGWVYIVFRDGSSGVATTTLHMMRWSRIKFYAQDNTAIQYWKGPASPTPADFVNDTNWSSSDSGKQPIITTGVAVLAGQVFYVPGINRYVLLTNSGLAHGTAVWHFFEARTPAGPWTEFFTFDTSPNGWIVPSFFHRDLITNTATDNIALRMLYAGDSTVPSLYKAHFSTLTLRTTMPVNTFVQGNASTSVLSGNPVSLAFSSNVAVGNLLVIAWRNSVEFVLNTVSDNMGVGNVWTVVYNQLYGANLLRGGWAYVFTKGSGPCTVSMNFAGSITASICAIAEYNGANANRSNSAVLTGQSGTVLGTNTITATAGDLLLGLYSVNTGNASVTQGAGWTLREQGSSAGLSYVAIEDILSSGSGSAGASITWGGSVVDSATGIADFFAQAFTISGSAGQAGATVSYSGAASGSVVADGSGNFTIPNLFNGAYTITPSLAGFSFTPTSRSVNMVSANVTGVNFTATQSSSQAFDIAFRGRLYVTRVVSGL